MKLFLGVDGGQTTTKAVVGDERGAILARATGGPSDHTEEPGGPERLERVARVTIGQALAAGGRSSDRFEFEGACFGMTGETEIKQRVLERFVRTPHLSVVHDSVNALEGATGGEPGLIVIAGTGSVARGRNAEGQDYRVGGWGHLFGDEGSGYWIGREAIRATLAEFDRTGQSTQLTPMLFERLGVTSAYQLMGQYYSGVFSREHLAGLAVWVNEAAKAGDFVAAQILRTAGRDLARFAGAILSKLFPSAISASEPKGTSGGPLVCYAGGVFKSRLVRESFAEAIRKEYPRAEVQLPFLPPVLGSLLLAYRAAGFAIPRARLSDWPQALKELPEPASGG